MFHSWQTKHLSETPNEHNLVTLLSLLSVDKAKVHAYSKAWGFYNSTFLLFFSDHFIYVQLDVWMLDPFQMKTLTCGIKPPTRLPTTQGIRMTYFPINKDTDNSGGLLAAAVASS